jgi:hypothetical protein
MGEVGRFGTYELDPFIYEAEKPRRITPSDGDFTVDESYLLRVKWPVIEGLHLAFQYPIIVEKYDRYPEDDSVLLEFSYVGEFGRIENVPVPSPQGVNSYGIIQVETNVVDEVREAYILKIEKGKSLSH